MGPPPILILMCDQQRADATSCAGDPVLRTPHMDRICAEGVRFSNACSVSPVCMPARASFVSGLYPHNHGLWTNRGALPADDETFFHHLQRIGYHVMYVGKSHFYGHGGFHLREREPYMHRRGIDTVHETTGPWATVTTRSYMTDHWETRGLYEVFKQDYEKRRKAGAVRCTWPSPLPEEEHLDSYIGRVACELAQAYDEDKPLCLFVGFGGPHEPWDPPRRHAEMYDPADCPLPIPAEELPATIPPHARRRALAGRMEIPEEQARKIRALYCGKIALIDEWFGRILEVYARRGWLDDALIIHWSDHGEMLGDHGRLHKCVFYDGSLKIQFNVRWPGHIQAGAVCDSLV